MHIVYHLGLHATDEERLLKCLLRNRDTLAGQGIAVPGPARYRTLLRDTAIQLRGQYASAETQAMVLDQIVPSDAPERLVLSWDNFLSYPQWVLKGVFYPAAAERVRAFARIFPDHSCEFHLAIRNPAGYLPDLFQRQRGKTYEDFLDGTDIHGLFWSEMIDRIRDENPDLPLTVWCDEDTPLIWPEVLQAVSGHDQATQLEGADDLLAKLMLPEGFRRMQAYLKAHPPALPDQRRGVVQAFLDKFVSPAANQTAIDLPGWTQETADDLTAAYDEDVARIAARGDVIFLSA